MDDRWTNRDEQRVISKYENPHRSQSGLPMRFGHKDLEGLGKDAGAARQPSGGSTTGRFVPGPDLLGHPG